MSAYDVLKQAIILEKRGKNFYSSVAETSKDEGVRGLFQTMAGEEEKHIAQLASQFKSYVSAKSFSSFASKEKPGALASAILTDALKGSISAAGYEAAAISAAIALEKNAIALYEERSGQAESENERALYTWLSEWEKTHLDVLVAIDKELTEKVWFDNSFWPF